MFKNSDSKIGVRECTSMLVLMLFTKATDDTASRFFKAGYNAGWMIPIFSGLTILLPLLCVLCLLKRYENKGLMEIINRLTGKYIGFILGYVLFSLNLIIISVNLRDNCNTINTLFFPKTDALPLIISLMGTCCFISMLGLKATARISWIVLLYIEFTVITFCVFSLYMIKVDFLFPIFGNGLKTIIGTGINNCSIYQGIILVAVCYPMFRNYKSFKTSTMLGLFISMLQLALLLSFYVMAFDYPAVSIINFHFFTATRLINVTRFISNLESLLIIPVVLSQVVYYSLYLYLVSGIFTYTIRLKKIEPLIPSVTSLIILISIIPENALKFSLISEKIVVPTLTITIIMLPIILLAISQLKGDYRR